jgi:hypothetical protein
MFSGSLHDMKEYLLRTFSQGEFQKKNWTPYKTFVHCAQTIEYAIDGYPEYEPLFIQNTVGKAALKKFLHQGFMKHSLTAPVPGAPAIHSEGKTEDGLRILAAAIDRFLHYDGELQRHLIFGKMNKQEYDAYFTMHIDDHLSEFTV